MLDPRNTLAPNGVGAFESDANNAPEVFVARQPILTRKQQVYGYELLYRSGLQCAFTGIDNVRATSDVISGAFLTIGFDRLVSNGRAFINFDAELLLSAVPAALPPERVVIELLETVEPDSAVIARCRELKRRGFQIALDDFCEEECLSPLIDIADIVKVDFRQTGDTEQRRFASEFRRRGIRLLAEKIETPEECQKAAEIGYTYFQGFFFARPATISGSVVRPFKAAYVQLLKETSREDVNLRRIEELLKHEPALTYQLLRYLNSALFSWTGRIESVRHALALLGAEEVRKWAAIVSLCGMAEGRPRALLAYCVIRARFCELLGRSMGLAARSAELFLMGMFSLFDVIVNRPLGEILSEIHMSGDIRAVLLGQESSLALTAIYSVVRAFESADWPAISAHRSALRIGDAALSGMYYDAVDWANGIVENWR